MANQADSIAQGTEESIDDLSNYPDDYPSIFLFWTEIVLTFLLCTLAFIFVVVLEPHYLACLICGWFGWFMIGISVKDGEYSSLLSVWIYLVMLGAPIGETLQLEREIAICCVVVMLPWLPLYVGTSVIESPEEILYVVTDAVQLFRVGGSMYTGCYMALLGLHLTSNRFLYFTGEETEVPDLSMILSVDLLWFHSSILPFLIKANAVAGCKRLPFPSMNATVFSFFLASFGTILSLGIRWVITEGPLSHLVSLESPVDQIIMAMFTLAINLGVVVAYSQIRRSIYPEQYMYAYQWNFQRLSAGTSQWKRLISPLIRLRNSECHQFSLDPKLSPISAQPAGRLLGCHQDYGGISDSRNTIEESPAEKNASARNARKAFFKQLAMVIIWSIIPPLAMLATAGISMIDNPYHAWSQLTGYVGWVGLLHSLVNLKLSSSIVAWVSLIASASNSEGENSSQRNMAIMIGSPCFLFIVRHFNTKVKDPSSGERQDLSDVEQVYEVSGTLGVGCLVATQWLLNVLLVFPLLSGIVSSGTKIRIGVWESTKIWQVDICIFVGAIIAMFCLAIASLNEKAFDGTPASSTAEVQTTDEVRTSSTEEDETSLDVPYEPFVPPLAILMQMATQVVLAPISFNFIESRVEAAVYQVFSVIWTLLVVLMFICICGVRNGHSSPRLVYLDTIEDCGVVGIWSIRRTFGLARRLKSVPDHPTYCWVLNENDP